VYFDNASQFDSSNTVFALKCIRLICLLSFNVFTYTPSCVHIVSKAADKSKRVRQVTLMTRSFDDIGTNGKKSSFSRMMFDKGRLERIEEVVGRYIVTKT